MTALEKLGSISIEDYLIGEQSSGQKHEYLGGTIHAMSGGTVNHSAIATNAVGSWFGQLSGKSCRPYNSDLKVRIDLPDHTRFYYPAAQIICQESPGTDLYATQPVVVLEVLSESTRRLDLGEKRDAYLAIPSLRVLILADSLRPYVIVHRRQQNGGFAIEEYTTFEATIDLPEAESHLALADLYQGVDFGSE